MNQKWNLDGKNNAANNYISTHQSCNVNLNPFSLKIDPNGNNNSNVRDFEKTLNATNVSNKGIKDYNCKDTNNCIDKIDSSCDEIVACHETSRCLSNDLNMKKYDNNNRNNNNSNCNEQLDNNSNNDNDIVGVLSDNKTVKVEARWIDEDYSATVRKYEIDCPYCNEIIKFKFDESKKKKFSKDETIRYNLKCKNRNCKRIIDEVDCDAHAKKTRQHLIMLHQQGKENLKKNKNKKTRINKHCKSRAKKSKAQQRMSTEKKAKKHESSQSRKVKR